MRTNTTRAQLAAGNVVFGGIVTNYAPDIVELLGAIGYDFVMIDCEHGPMSWDQVENMVRAAEAFCPGVAVVEGQWASVPLV